MEQRNQNYHFVWQLSIKICPRTHGMQQKGEWGKRPLQQNLTLSAMETDAFIIIKILNSVTLFIATLYFPTLITSPLLRTENEIGSVS